MPEPTLSSHPPEASFPNSAPTAGDRRDGQALTAVRASPGAAEAANLLMDGQQLLLESRADEAEPVLLRALELYERENDPRTDYVQNEVAAILGSLARLYLHIGQVAKAEPVLQRLLQIKRARGDDHPEVATVLASLARAHSAMGAHESAERILRRVLSIRERTLAPNHFATLTTIEHLADACAARGKFEEALDLLHQALTMRERTLGVADPSIAAARARIADLELFTSNETSSALPVWRPTALPQGSGGLLAVDARQDAPAEGDGIPAAEYVVEMNAVSHPTTREELEDDWEDEVASPTGVRPLLDRLAAKVSSAADLARSPRGRVTVLAVGVVSLLSAMILAVAMRARADVTPRTGPAVAHSERHDTTNAPNAGGHGSDVMAQPALPPGSGGATATRSAMRSYTPATSARRFPASEAREATFTRDPETTPVPNAPRLRALDARIDEAPIAPVVAPPVVAAEFTPKSGALSERATVLPGSVVRAVLPTNNPAPEYPRELMRQRVEGHVVAEFLVDAKGRVDPRTVRINSSTDEAFSQAVLDVLPQLRFLPAERDGVKTEEWVAMPFRFAPKPE
jgi:TonB family protein